MSLTVEDGTGLEAADAYVSVAYVASYFEARGGTNSETWSGLSTAEKEQAIVRATDYVDKRFGHMFVGSKSTLAQALAWPRLSAFDQDGFELEDVVPVPLKKAVAEYAVRAALLVLVPDPVSPFKQEEGSSSVTVQPVGQILRKKTVAGPVESEVEYQPNSYGKGSSNSSGLASDFALPEYPAADLLLKPILRAGFQSKAIRN